MVLWWNHHKTTAALIAPLCRVVCTVFYSPLCIRFGLIPRYDEWHALWALVIAAALNGDSGCSQGALINTLLFGADMVSSITIQMAERISIFLKSYRLD